MKIIAALSVALACACAAGTPGEFQAGIARVNITPATPFWMSGYMRTNQSVGVIQQLWARALALRDPQGHRIVIVASDLIGFHHRVSDTVFVGAKKRFGLERADVLLTCSHTHSGPVVGSNLSNTHDFTDEDNRHVQEYATQLTDKLIGVIGESLNTLAPARLAVGHGAAGFAVNRRQRTATGAIQIGVNPDGPVDHDVPVLKVTSPDGKLRAVFFGYACHNTTIGGISAKDADFYKIHGDYAGQAQAELERLHPGAMAMFTSLCAGDQNPNPRSSLQLVIQHGNTLATEVNRVLGSELRSVNTPIRTAYQSVQLDFAAHTRQTFEDELKKAEDPKKPDRFLARRARMMLDGYDKGHPIRQASCPVQAIRLGSEFSIIALGGEVVVDYQLRVKREFPKENLMVIGYANDVMCYIPSQRVLREGGYEAERNMVGYGQPGPFAETVEETLLGAIHRAMKEVGAGK
jgi:hypothetical protein